MLVDSGYALCLTIIIPFVLALTMLLLVVVIMFLPVILQKLKFTVN